MKYKLNTLNYNEEDASLLLNQLLKDRGIKNPAEWLFPKKEMENSPLMMKNMGKALDILDQTLKIPDSNILVVVDADLDGYSSGAIIYFLLQHLSYKQEINYVLHPGKEHGLVLKDIPEDTDLIIVPDASSSEKNLHMELLKKGKKIIILDHHEIDNNDMDYGTYENNIAIVNSMVDYENPALSGAGVALKFAMGYYHLKGKPFPMILYALAACGIVADVMDMSYLENKYIVDTGVKYIDEHLFLKAMIDKAHYNMEDPVSTIKDIGWVIGPNINAVIRLGTMEQKHIIFRALVNPDKLIFSTKRGGDMEEIPLYQEAVRICDNAKKRQTTAVNKGMSIVENNLTETNHNSIIYIDKEQELSFELSGLIANKLLSKYNKPTLLLKEYINDKGIKEYRGSVRSKSVEGADNFKEIINGITGVEYAQGHASAFGIAINEELFKEFKVHLNDIVDKLDFSNNFYKVDSIADFKQVNIENATIMARDDIWCHGVEKPICAIENIPTKKFEIMGTENQHVKIDGGKYDIVIFNAPELAKDLLMNKRYNITAIGEYDVDKSYNIGRLQFIVKDYALFPFEEEDDILTIEF